MSVRDLSFTAAHAYPPFVTDTNAYRYMQTQAHAHGGQAMRTKDLREMITRVDHSLTRDGVENANELHDLWQARRGGGRRTVCDGDTLAELTDQQLEEGFAGVDLVFSSPLTRAVQTARIVLHDHPAVSRHGIVLLRAAREIKRALSLDSVGKASGLEVAERAHELLARVVGEHNAKAVQARIDFHDCASPWHTQAQAVDTEGDVGRRMADLMCSLRYADFASGILVTHSLFLQAFVRIFAGDTFKARSPHMARHLTAKKLDNSACICVLLDFTRDAEIADVRPMFGTVLDV
jgi:broad specificity phosphatase PhoE